MCCSRPGGTVAIARDAVISAALAIVGACAVGPRAAEYADAIKAPGEQNASGCALISGRCIIVRAFVRVPSCLTEDYLRGHAMSDVLHAIRSADAWRRPVYPALPAPGDIVHVAEAGDESGHVFVLVRGPIDDACTYEGVDGGQRDAAGHECVRLRRHEIAWSDGKLLERAQDAADEPWTAWRVVDGWGDADAMGAAWQVKDRGDP